MFNRWERGIATVLVAVMASAPAHLRLFWVNLLPREKEW